MILSPGGDSDSASPLRSISCESCLVSPADVEKIDDIEMHYYDSDAAKSIDVEVKIAGTVDSSSSSSSESQQLLAVVKQMAMLGFNAVLLLADSAKRFELLQSSDTCQKLLMTLQHHPVSSEAAHGSDSDSADAVEILAERGTDQNSSSSSSDDDNNSNATNDDGISDIYRDAVNSVLSSMSQHSIQSSYIGGDGSSSPSLVDPVTMDPGSVTISSSSGHFHVMGQTSASTSISIDSRLDSDGDISQVDLSGTHEVITGTDTTHRTLRTKSSNPLRVFSIRFWS